MAEHVGQQLPEEVPELKTRDKQLSGKLTREKMITHTSTTITAVLSMSNFAVEYSSFALVTTSISTLKMSNTEEQHITLQLRVMSKKAHSVEYFLNIVLL